MTFWGGRLQGGRKVHGPTSQGTVVEGSWTDTLAPPRACDSGPNSICELRPLLGYFQ